MCQKRTYFLPFVFALLTSISLSAQEFSLGVKAGGLVSWAAFGDKTQKDTFATRIGPGYLAGFQIGFPMKENFSLMVEAGGARKERTLLFNDKNWRNRTIYHFLDGTMLLRKGFKFEFEKNVPADWFFSLGPEVSYWFSSHGRVAVDGPGTAYRTSFTDDPTNEPNDPANPIMYYQNANRWLFSLVFGVGFKAPLLHNQKIAGELRFVSGHTFLGGRNSSSIPILGFEDTMLTNLKSVNLVVSYTFEYNVQRARTGKSTLNKKLKKNR